MRNTVIFDGDDTLWETQPLYEAAKERFFRVMAESGFKGRNVARRFESIDRSNVATFGFGRERFPQSMLDTYVTLCREQSVAVDDARMSYIRGIGEAVFQERPALFDGVEGILTTLRDAGFTLLLATKGDREVQEQRVVTSGLRTYFDATYILEQKGVEEFSRITSEWEVHRARSWSVGNSVRSDIVPALAIGLNAIYIPNASWAYEHEDLPKNKRLRFASSLREVPEIVLGRQG